MLSQKHHIVNDNKWQTIASGTKENPILRLPVALLLSYSQAVF